MTDFKTFVRKFGNIQKFAEKRMKEILIKNGRDIVEMVKEQQHEGINVEGQVMQSGYSPQYGKRRSKKGLQTRFVDLHFSGKMHKGLKVIPVPGGVDVRSKEPYEYYVRANFPKAFGLTKENAEQVAEIVARQLAVDIKKELVG